MLGGGHGGGGEYVPPRRHWHELELRAVDALRLLGWAQPARDEVEQVVMLARDRHEDGLFESLAT